MGVVRRLMAVGGALAALHAAGRQASGHACGAVACGPQGMGRTWLLVISGVSGEKRFAEAFTAMGTSLVDAARTRFAIADSMVWYLAEDSARDPARIRGRSTKANVEGTLGRMVAGGREGDRLVVILFGHGSAQGDAPRLNLPGPDMTVDDFARVLAPSKAMVVVANTASASGEFVKALSGSNRIIITATKSAREQNETFFPSHFVKALVTATGDTDKDGRVSLLEAFTYARREVEKMFEQGNRLPSEHPMLDDDGDGVGHGDASDRGPDGPRARAFFLEPLGGANVASDPRAARLIEERRAVEARIDSLRSRRAAMSEDAYQKALEPLLLELAEKTRALRALEPKKP
ncbi:MAG: hypothetical protein ACT4P7_14085 [Gemmatimonadaceae bacterium]